MFDNTAVDLHICMKNGEAVQCSMFMFMYLINKIGVPIYMLRLVSIESGSI